MEISNYLYLNGIKFEYEVDSLLYEIDRKEPLDKIVFWDSNLNKKPTAIYKKDIFETKAMYDLLQNYYQDEPQDPRQKNDSLTPSS